MEEMKKIVYGMKVTLDWRLVRKITEIARFDASWASIEYKEGNSLKQLRTIATVSSAGASTRIEGAQLDDAQVDELLQKIDISKLSERDQQEVAGYYHTLEFIGDNHANIPVTESAIQSLHKMMLQYSEKDHWHFGRYKQQTNSVEAQYPDGSRRIIFRTTPPGFPTEDAMRNLVEWYNSDHETSRLVKIAIFTYEFLSIHPFQDGNGRLSRLLSTLLLLKENYKWVQYVSMESDIEFRKDAYYRSLRECQAQRPGEDVSSWLDFFLSVLVNVQIKLMEKLRLQGLAAQLSPRDKAILVYIGERPGCRSGQIARSLEIPNPTVKRILTQLVKRGLLQRFGKGPGTNYALP